ncbi:MAG: hypothetical protein AAFQ75_03255 [Pseudomonadota bacterium]
MFDISTPAYAYYAEPLKCGSLPVYDEPTRLDKMLGINMKTDEPPALAPAFRRRAHAEGAPEA